MRKFTLMCAAAAMLSTTAMAANYTLSPEAGSVVEALNSVTVTFDGRMGFDPNNTCLLENIETGDIWNAEVFGPMLDNDGNATYIVGFVELGGETAEITDDGSYVLSLRGFGMDTENADGEIEWDYIDPIIASYAIYPVDYTLDPANGSIVTDLSKVTLTFPGNPNVGVVDLTGAAVISLENTTTGDIYYCAHPNKIRNMYGDSVITLNFAELGSSDELTITTPGTYVLSIRGLYSSELNGNDQIDSDLPMIMARYDIVAPVDYTLDPADGSVVSELNNITITFNGKVRIDDTLRPAAVTLENRTTGDIYYCYTPLLADVRNPEESAYTLQFFEMGGEEPVAITTVGEYTLSIRGAYNGVSTDEDGDEVKDYLPVITANYSIVYPVAYTLDPANGAKVSDLSKITLTFPENMVAYYDNATPAIATLENKTTGDLYYCTSPQMEYVMDEENGTEGVEYYLSFYDLGSDVVALVNQPGEYVLSVRGLYTAELDDSTETGTKDPEDLPVIIANYTIEYPVSYTLTPEAGASVKDLSEITVAFEAGVNVGYYDARPAVGVLENKTTGDVYYCEAPMISRNGEGENTMVFKFTELGSSDEVEVVTPGDYEFSIHGLYTTDIVNGEETEPVDLPVLTANYTIAYPVNYTLTPGEGATLTAIEDITVVFETGVNVGYYDARPAVGVLENKTTSEVWYCETPAISRSENGESTMVFTFAELGSSDAEVITSVGDYEFSIHGLYTSEIVDGEETEPVDLPVLTANYSIVYPVTYTLDPANGAAVTNLSAITLTFPDNLVAFYDNTTPAVATLENVTTGDIYYCYEPQAEYVMNEETGDEGIEYHLAFYEAGSEEVVSITALGDYVLSVRGLYTATLTEDGEIDETQDLPVLTAKYEVVYPVEYTLDPMNGASVENLSAITLTFPVNLVAFYDNTTPAVATLENVTTGDLYYCYEPQAEYIMNEETGDAGIEYHLAFYEAGSEEVANITAVGEYVLSVRGLYTATMTEDGDIDETQDLPVITANYSIEYPVDYYLDPASGSKVDDLSTVVLTFPNNSWIGVLDVRPAPIVLENLTTGDVYYCQNPLKRYNENGGAVFTMTFSELGSSDVVPVAAIGEYQLSIRGLYMTTIDGNDVNDVELPTIVAKYEIAYPVNYTLDPADGEELESISTVTLTFPGLALVGIEDVHPAPVALENLTTGDIYYCENPMKSYNEDGDAVFTIEFSSLGSEETESEININGTYELSIRGLYVTEIVEGEEGAEETEIDTPLPTITAKYYIVNGVDGIESVISSDVYNVYGINGIQVVRNGNAEQVNALPAGLYIINGKKVLINK